MCIQDEVSTRINGSALPACGLKLLWCDQIGAGAGVLDEFCHAHAAVEVRDSSDNGFAFGLRLREPDGILKFIFRNINSSFHASKIVIYGSLIKHNYILYRAVFEGILVGHGHDPSDAAVPRVASDVQLGYVEAGRYALAALVAAVPVPCDVPGLPVSLLGEERPAGQIVEPQVQGAGREHVDEVERNEELVVDAVAVGRNERGAEREASKKLVGYGQAHDVGTALDLGCGVAGVNKLSRLRLLAVFEKGVKAGRL